MLSPGAAFPEAGSSLLFSLLSYILRITEVGVKEGESCRGKQGSHMLNCLPGSSGQTTEAEESPSGSTWQRPAPVFWLQLLEEEHQDGLGRWCPQCAIPCSQSTLIKAGMQLAHRGSYSTETSTRLCSLCSSHSPAQG